MTVYETKRILTFERSRDARSVVTIARTTTTLRPVMSETGGKKIVLSFSITIPLGSQADSFGMAEPDKSNNITHRPNVRAEGQCEHTMKQAGSCNHELSSIFEKSWAQSWVIVCL